MNLEVQWLTLGVMLATGVGMGILFDSYRVVSDYFKAPKWSLSIMDMLYWIGSAIIVFRMLYLANYGEVRGYVFIGLASGVLLYALIISSLYSKFVLACIHIIKRIINVIMKTIDKLLIKPVLLLYKFVLTCVKIGTKFTIRLLQIMLQLFIPILKVLFWPFKPLLLPIGRYCKHVGEQKVFPLLRRWNLLQQTISLLIKCLAAIKKWIYS